jgi:HSP20 family protein
MSAKKWIPWNWFKNEEESAGKSVPVQRASVQERSHPLSTVNKNIVMKRRSEP